MKTINGCSENISFLNFPRSFWILSQSWWLEVCWLRSYHASQSVFEGTFALDRSRMPLFSPSDLIEPRSERLVVIPVVVVWQPFEIWGLMLLLSQSITLSMKRSFLLFGGATSALIVLTRQADFRDNITMSKRINQTKSNNAIIRNGCLIALE